ncbi:hypothetical protein DFH09DRAFT_1488686 [Mycena vulgaris]|nr:hypothetical protein DFH09DRAFT_1488686 [Mycena vulgaris]
MSSEGIGLKPHSMRDNSPLQHPFGRVWHWFRARASSPRRSTNEKFSNASPPLAHAQTEDASAKFWSVYISEAERYDSALVESWKADMEGMLIFSGLFSASLTAFIIESYKNLTPDTGNMTVALLSQLSQQISAQANGSQFPLPSSTAPYEVQTSSLVCNGFWFVSLGLSLTCALLATLVEQWAREFLHKTDIRPSPVRRARVFSFLYYGVSRFGIHAIVDIIPLLLHVALVLFFAGLAAFLLPINALMTGIVSSILATFLAFYIVITILPVVALDCPYRTPLSGLFWRLLQHLSGLFNLPSTNQSLTDVVLAAAMKRRDIRDERAVLWTLDSLTDNTELLPFVEAIPEIIYGPGGFRHIDDHLFRLVLHASDSHTSLANRILALLWSAETLPLDDPLHSRRQTEGLRALWALGIVASRLPPAPITAVYGIEETSLNALTIPVTYRIALDAVIKYARLRKIKRRFEEIEGILFGRPISTARERKKLVRVLRGEMAGLEMAVRGYEAAAPELNSALQILDWVTASNPEDRASHDNFIIARGVIRDLNSDQLWSMHFAQIAVELLTGSFWAGLAPYRLLATCEEILPEVPTLAVHLQCGGFWLGGRPEYLLPAVHSRLPDGPQNELDVMMRCMLRLIPLLDPLDYMPTIYWYLANRSRGNDAFQYAFAECNWNILATAMLDHLRRLPHPSGETLRGIVTLWLWRQPFQLAWIVDCWTVLSMGDANTESNTQTHPAYPSMQAILSSFMLSVPGAKIAGKTGVDCTAWLDTSIPGMGQDLATHPLLRETYHTFTTQEAGSAASVMETLDQIASEISEQYAAVFTRFLTECAHPVQPPYKAAATVEYLVHAWHPFIARGMSARRQLELAHAVLRLVECACDKEHLSQPEVTSVVQGFWDCMDSEFQVIIRDPPSVSVLAQARALYRPSSDAVNHASGPPIVLTGGLPLEASTA